ncbi:GDP-perosamine N-acetyltransferase [Kerstersia gyiorum]|uniref:GDP-perosamine N-acetyltransferase n=1 Tax=Kerstersia gyiorum TaxID=206506 RepID=A0A4Q7MH28_9BURK|nr:acetyltransferase [Kerstersia gyiorum]KAB0542982.1 acetyltransferase [Kerstersia gyiorum]MCI1227702.1 acetyltransferase [Kerstersia gyiorum]RZS67474.1 GDP-perosamine N-acetyltransferase [Kerstersia gyiorum]
MKTYAIFGAGGYGRETIPVARMMLQASLQDNYRLVFVSDTKNAETINGYPLLSKEEFLALTQTEKFFNIAIGDSQTRERISHELIAAGIKPFTITSPSTVIFDANEIGSGAILSPFTTITSNAKIGKFFHANIYSYVAHDCVIGDYVTFAPSVKCNGGVIIEDHAYIGTGAVIKQSMPNRPIVIGAGAIVGMGAVVTKSVPAGATVLGNPAKPLRAL